MAEMSVHSIRNVSGEVSKVYIWVLHKVEDVSLYNRTCTVFDCLKHVDVCSNPAEDFVFLFPYVDKGLATGFS